MQESTHKMRKSASELVLIRMQLTVDATRRTPSQRFALSARDVRRVGENPTCSVPALKGCEGIWYRTSAKHEVSTPSPPVRAHVSTPGQG